MLGIHVERDAGVTSDPRRRCGRMDRTRLTVASALCAVAAGTLAPAAARADDVLAPLPAQSGIAAAHGIVAFSQESGGANHLALRTADGRVKVPARAPDSERPLDVSVATVGGRTLALYSSCHGDRCKAVSVDTSSGVVHNVPVDRSSQPIFPVRSGSAYAYVKRVGHCDVPYARVGGHSRRLDRGHCADITGMTLKGRVLALTTEHVGGSTPRTAQIRSQSIRGGKARTLLTRNSGEESVVYTSPAIVGDDVAVVQLTNATSFLRVSRRGGGRAQSQTVAARTGLNGTLAVDGSAWYFGDVGLGDSTGYAADTACATDSPCRLIRTTDPFSTTARTLAPHITLTTPPNTARATQPFVVSGAVVRDVVSRGQLTATLPVAGVDVRLAHTDPFVSPPTSEPIAAHAATGADGRWAIAVAPPIPTTPFYTPTAATPVVPVTVAQGTTGTTAADVTLSGPPTPVPANSPTTVSGTVDPPQLGRSMEIRQGTRLVTTVPIAPDGRTFTAQVTPSATGTWSARLAFAKPVGGHDGGYTGESAPITIAVG